MKIFYIQCLLCLFLFSTAQARNYQINVDQSTLTFTATYLGFFELKAKCTEFSGTIHWHDGYPNYSSFEGLAAVKSITTGHDLIDNQLMSKDLFDQANYPEIVFKSVAIESVTANQFIVSGLVTAKGVSVEISEPLIVTKESEQPTIYRLQSQFSVNRRDFEIGNSFSTLIVGPKIKIMLDFVVKR